MTFRWANIVKYEDRWILIDFDDAAVMGPDGQVPGCPRMTLEEHAPIIHEEHDAHVDVWGLAHLLTNCPANVNLSQNIRESAYNIKRNYEKENVNAIMSILQSHKP